MVFCAVCEESVSMCVSVCRLFFIIEFVNGGDLMFHMQRKRRLHEEEARFYSAEICHALNFLHDKGVMHCRCLFVCLCCDAVTTVKDVIDDVFFTG